MTTFEPYNEGQEWMTPALFDWIENNFVPFIDLHHRCEEALNEKLKKRAQKKGVVWPKDFDEIPEEHEQIIPVMFELVKFRKRIECCTDFDEHLS